MNITVAMAFFVCTLVLCGCERQPHGTPERPVFGEQGAPEQLGESASWLLLVTDQSSPTLAVDDDALTRHVTSALAADPLLARSAIRVDANAGMITLIGAVESLTAVRRAGAIALNVKGVVSVDNRLSLLVSL